MTTLSGIDLTGYVTCPLSPSDLLRLETAVQRALPPGIKSFLESCGFPQNVAPAVFQDEAAFIRAQDTRLGHAFTFAESDELLFAETVNGVVIEIDGSKERSAFPSFAEFLRAFTSKPDDGRELCWAVQLSFSTAAELEVRNLVERLLPISFSHAWEELGVSAAGVKSSQAVSTTPGGAPLKRLEYAGWPSPMFFLDQRVDKTELRSFKEAVRACEASSLGFTLINYGVLPRDI